MINTRLKLLAASGLLMMATSAASAQELISGGVKDYVQLGMAYNSMTGEFISAQAVMGEKGLIEAKGGVAETDVDLDFKKVSSLVNGSLAVQADFPVIKANAGAEVALSSAVDDYSLNWVVSVVNRAGTYKLNDFGGLGAGSPPLSQYGSSVEAQAQAGTITDAELLQLVGDSYISEITYGSHLFVSMKAEFSSLAEKTAFAGTLEVNLDNGAVNANLEGRLANFSEERKAAVKVTVRAYQAGGNPATLLNIIPGGILECSYNNLSECATLFSNTIKYAQSVSPYNTNNGFKKPSTVAEPMATANVLSFQTETYANNAKTFNLSRTYQTVNNTTRLNDLENRYIEEVQNSARATTLLSNSITNLNDYQRAALRNTRDVALQNAEALKDLVEYCETHPYQTETVSCADYIFNNCRQSGSDYACLAEYNTDIFSFAQNSEFDQATSVYSRTLTAASVDELMIKLFDAPDVTAYSLDMGGSALSITGSTGKIRAVNGMDLGANNHLVNAEFVVKSNYKIPTAGIGTWSGGTQELYQMSVYGENKWLVAQQNTSTTDNTVMQKAQSVGGWYYYRFRFVNSYSPSIRLLVGSSSPADMYFLTKDVFTMPMTTGLKVPSTPLYFTSHNMMLDRDVNNNWIGYCPNGSGGITRSSTSSCQDFGRMYSKSDAKKVCAAYDKKYGGETGLFWSLPKRSDYELLVERVAQDSGAGLEASYLKSYQFDKKDGAHTTNDFYGFSIQPAGYIRSTTDTTHHWKAKNTYYWMDESSGTDTMVAWRSSDDITWSNIYDYYLFPVRCVGTYTKR